MIKLKELLTEANVPSNIASYAKRKGVESLVNQVADWAEKSGKRIVGGTAIGKNYSTLILDLTHQGGEVRINTDTDIITVNGTEVTDSASFKKALMSSSNEQINEDITADLLELLIPVVIAIGLWALNAIPRAIGALVLKVASVVSPKVKQQVDMVKDAIESSVTEDGAITRLKAKQIAKDILTDKEMTSLILKAAGTTNVKKKEEYLKSFNEYMQAKYPDSDRYLKTFIKTYVRQGAAYKSRKNDYKRP